MDSVKDASENQDNNTSTKSRKSTEYPESSNKKFKSSSIPVDRGVHKIDTSSSRKTDYNIDIEYQNPNENGFTIDKEGFCEVRAFVYY